MMKQGKPAAVRCACACTCCMCTVRTHDGRTRACVWAGENARARPGRVGHGAWPWMCGRMGWDGLQGTDGDSQGSEREREGKTDRRSCLSSLDRSIDSPHRPVDATCIKSSSDRKQQTGRRDITGRQRRETRAATSSGLEAGGNEEAWMTEYHQAGNGADLQYKRWVASGWCWCRRWADVLSAFWSPFLPVEYGVHVVGILIVA